MDSIAYDLARLEAQAELEAAIERMGAPLGRARQATWLCEDGWYVKYTTSRIAGGPYDGKFLVQTFKPVGKGSRSGRGKAEEWMMSSEHAYAKRKTAKAHAEVLYAKHSPKWAAAHA